MKNVQSEKMKIIGLNTGADIYEFISAVEAHTSNVSNIKIHESVGGTAKAFASLLKRFENNNSFLLNLFATSGCIFIAGWSIDDADTDYRANIDMSSLPVLTSLKIIRLDKKLKKEDKENEAVDKILKGLIYNKR